ncbi:hypothetical protein F2P81_022370 [Scophthalmus maximus]|uniref:Uncharacterized protein n=1 Tax=Scophthalmus maximus TaxID=52904 RepID=A0A6A4RYW2_SCOMX|nr:hypothetical protein F2P81_022370 [Scophthalmus maximus]
MRGRAGRSTVELNPVGARSCGDAVWSESRICIVAIFVLRVSALVLRPPRPPTPVLSPAAVLFLKTCKDVRQMANGNG